MNDLLLLGSALYQKTATNGTVTTYYQKAPQDASTPYCLVQYVTATDEYTFGDRGINATYSIKVVTDHKLPFGAINLYSTVHSTVQDSVLTITGYQTLRIRRESQFQFEDPQHFWNVGGIYSLDVWQT
jgi:hypothetical protein